MSGTAFRVLLGLFVLTVSVSATFSSDPISVVQVNEQAISITWTAAVNPIDFYNVFASRAGQNDFQLIFSTPETSALIPYILHSVAFDYFVKVDGVQTQTSAFTVTAPANPVANPATLPPPPVVTEISSSSAYFTWTAFGNPPYVVEAFLDGEWRPVFSDGDPGLAPQLFAVIPVEIPGAPLAYRVTSPTDGVSTPAVNFATSAADNIFGFNPAKNALKITTHQPELLVAYSDNNMLGSVDPTSFELSFANDAQALVKYDLTDPSLDLCNVLYARLVFPSVLVSNGFLDGGFIRVFPLADSWDNTANAINHPEPIDPHYYVSDAQAQDGVGSAIQLPVNLDIVLPGSNGAVPTIQSWIDGPSSDNDGFLIGFDSSDNTVLTVSPPLLEIASFTPLQGLVQFGANDFENTIPAPSNCVACSGPAICSSDPGGSDPTTVSDAGQVPVTATLISVQVLVRGNWDSTLDNRFYVSLAGVLVEEKYVSGTSAPCDDSVCQVESFQSPDFLPQVGGWPNYEYGGLNELHVVLEGGELCVNEVTILYTYIDQTVVDPNCAPPSATPTPTITPSRTPSSLPPSASPSPSQTPLPPSSLPSVTPTPAASPMIVGPSVSPSPLVGATVAPSASGIFNVPTPSPFPSPSRSPMACVGGNSSNNPACQPQPTIAPLPDDEDAVIVIEDPAGEPVGTVVIPPGSTPDDSDVVITPVDVLPDRSPNLSIPVDIKIFRDGVEVPLTGEIEICLSVVNSDIENSCLGFINDEGEWECQDNCLTEKDGQVCGTTDHLTSFAVLFSGGAAEGCVDSSEQYIFDELWKDLLMIALISGAIVCCLFGICILLVIAPGGSRLVYGKEGHRIRSLRSNNTASLRASELEIMEEDALHDSGNGGIQVEEL